MRACAHNAFLFRRRSSLLRIGYGDVYDSDVSSRANLDNGAHAPLIIDAARTCTFLYHYGSNWTGYISLKGMSKRRFN